MSGTASADVEIGRFPVTGVDLPGKGLAWLRGLREAARRRFAETGLPTARDEDWKYSDPSVIGETAYEPWPSTAVDTPAETRLEDAHRIVLVNGRLREDLSSRQALPEGVVIAGLADALRECPDLVRPHLGTLVGREAGGFAALDTALFTDGIFLLVPEGIRLERPVLVLARTTSGDRPSASHLRNLVVVGARGSVRFVTAHDSNGASFTNAVTEVVAGDESEIDHVQIETGGARTHLVDHQVFELGRSARVRTRHVSLGRGWVRCDLRAVLAGENAELGMSGVTVATERRHVDFHTTIDHAMPHGRSEELFKTIADEGSTGVFTGRIIVRQDAQKTDARQMSRNLLLSEGATVWTRPQLEIHADDVKCAHGATIGRLDDEALFYLRSRGIDASAARRLLMSAFMAEVIDDIVSAELRESLLRRLERRLPDDGDDET